MELSAEMKKGVLEILWVVRARVFLGVCFRQHLVKAEQLSQCRPVTVIATLKPVLNWANVCSPEHTSDTSTNYDSFLN